MHAVGLVFGRKVKTRLDRLSDRIHADHFEVDIERLFSIAPRFGEDPFNGGGPIVQIRK